MNGKDLHMKRNKAAAILAAMTLFCTAFTACGGEQKESLPDTAPDTTKPVETTAPEEETTEAPTTAETKEATTAAETETTAATETETTMTSEETTAEETTAAPVETAAPTEAPTQPPETDALPIETDPPAGFDAADLRFTYGGSTLTVGEDASGFIGAVPANSSESAPSCYGDGNDTNYYYNDFTLYIWDNGTTKMTYGIDITGTGAATAEGITIGSSVKDLVAAYGNGYTEELSDYVYTVGDSNIRFTIAGGMVTYISYNYNL